VRIDTWKSIARYLGRSSRTVQRWHREYGLPVHRLGVDTGSIYAYADELDTWLRNVDWAPQNTLFEFAGPEPGRRLQMQSEPERYPGVFDSPCIPRSRRLRSAALVSFANRLWASASNENLKMIAKGFREAIDLDPGNAAAFAGLSHALVAQGLAGIIRTPGAYVAAKAALERASEIDAELPETKCAAAWLKIVLDRDWHGARRGLDDCLKQRLPCERALVGRALLHIAEGCPEEAASLLREFVLEHALNAEASALHCWSVYLAEDSSDALNLVEESRASGQYGPVFDVVEALACIHCEKPDAYIPRLETLVADSPRHELLRGVLGYAFALNGQAQRATAILDAIARAPSSERNTPYATALVLLGLNEKHDAVRWLEQSYRNGSLWSLGFTSDPILRPLRDEPSYRMFLSMISHPAPRRHGPASEGSSAALGEAVRVSGLDIS
jgi:hypothetical protein